MNMSVVRQQPKYFFSCIISNCRINVQPASLHIHRLATAGIQQNDPRGLASSHHVEGLLLLYHLHVLAAKWHALESDRTVTNLHVVDTGDLLPCSEYIGFKLSGWLSSGTPSSLNPPRQMHGQGSNTANGRIFSIYFPFITLRYFFWPLCASFISHKRITAHRTSASAREAQA